MISIQQYMALAAALFIFVISPGPGVFATVSRSLSHGTQAGLIITLGLVAGDLVYLSLAMLGLVALANLYPTVFLGLQLLGALWLIYLSYSLSTSMPELVVDNSTRQKKTKTNFSHFSAGLAISLTNPKVILFYLGVLPGFFDLSAINITEKITIIILASVVLFVGCGAYAVLTGRARHLFSSPKAVLRLNRVAASLLFITACWIIWRCINALYL